MAQVAQEVRRRLTGGYAEFSYAEAPAVVKELDSWSHRRLHGYLWQPWGRRGSRARVNRRVRRELA